MFLSRISKSLGFVEESTKLVYLLNSFKEVYREKDFFKNDVLDSVRIDKKRIDCVYFGIMFYLFVHGLFYLYAVKELLYK